MATPKQDMKRLHMAIACWVALRRKGAWADIIIKMPGRPNGRKTRRFSANGPRGEIIMVTHDHKKMLTRFSAAKLLTSLDKIRRHVLTRKPNKLFI